MFVKNVIHKSAALVAILYAVIGVFWVLYGDEQYQVIGTVILIFVGAVLIYSITRQRFYKMSWANIADRESQVFLDRIFYGIDLPVFLVNVTPAGEFYYADVNPAYENLIGIKKDDLVGKSPEDMMPLVGKNLMREVIEDYQRCVSTNLPIEKESKIHHRGKDVWFLRKLTPVADNDGNVVTIVGSTTYTTESKHAAEAIRESERRLVEAQEVAQIGSWEYNLDNNYLWWSDQVYRLFEQDPEEELDAPTFEHAARMYSHESSEIFGKAISAAIGSGERNEVELSLTLPSGRAVVHTVMIKPVTDSNGRISMLIGTVQDITERKHDEDERKKLELQVRQLQKLEALGTLAGGIAHDFNNILTGSLGFTELAMLKLGESHPVSEYLEHIMKAGHRSRDLIRQILTFSRQDAAEREPVNCAVVIEEALQLMRASLPQNIQIKFDPEVAEAVIYADASQIHQVIINLCTNAKHAMPDGGVINIALEMVEYADAYLTRTASLDKGGYFKISIQDTGLGIQEELIDKIFDPFFTTKDVKQGTGLGLSVVHGIVGQHEGGIDIVSKVGTGTTFHIFLPKLDAKVPARLVSSDLLKGDGQRILFVDDEEAITLLVSELLIELGYAVSVFNSPKAALEHFTVSSDDYALLMTDMSMPEMSGLHLARKALDVKPDIDIILLTGNIDDVGEISDFGISEILSKPVTLQVLAESVSRVVKRDDK